MKKFLIMNFILLLSTINFCQISYNQEFQVNTYTPYSQSKPSTCGLTNGGFVISWEGDRLDGSGTGIFAQIYNENRTKVGNEFQVNTYTNNDQKSTSICGLKNGGFVISWISFGQDGSWAGIYAQIYDGKGTKVGNEFLVNTYTNTIQYTQYTLSTSGLTNGGFVISWDNSPLDGSFHGIFAQIYDENGAKVGDEFQVNTYTNDWQIAPSIYGLANGGFVISWQSLEQDGSGYGIYAQIYNENGAKVGNEFLVNTYTNDWQIAPSIYGLANGGFVISWTSEGQDGSEYGIYAQIYNETGTKVGNEFQVNSYTNSWQEFPSVCGLTNGGFVISWQSYKQDGSAFGIYAQIYDENGNKVGNEFLVNTYTNYDQMLPKTCALTNGGFVISWQSFVQDGNSDGIFGKYYLGAPIKHSLTNYNALKPSNDSTLIDKNPTFVWNKTSETHINFPWELTYDLYIDKNETFPDPILISGIEDTTYQIDSLQPGQTYFWKVLARNYYGDSLWSTTVNGFYIDPNATDIEAINSKVPTEFKLEHNYPNPFNPTTTIEYSLPSISIRGNSKVSLVIYDILGRKIKTLVNKEQPSGTYKVTFNGIGLSSGIYFYRLNAGNRTEIKKFILMK